ncbi:MAG: bifunctional DNA primase/polymerase [Desulfovibrionaceae bacterium]|nr:bifunctional DNA primase/polymerase [Desulfovibrionaceae bacterium]
MNATLNHARKLARAGKPVFPCRQDNKRPLIDGGFKSATTDENQIRAWWEKWPDAMIGMPTGAASGVWVLDVDAAKEGEAGDGHASLAELTGRCGPLPSTRTHATPSGGQHLLFKYPEGREVRNSASKVGPLLDVRGEGGYIIMSPSVNAEGNAYKVTDASKTVDAPDWLLDLVAPLPTPEHEKPEQHTYRYHGGPLHPYVQAAVDGEIEKAASAIPNTRNHSLNAAAYALGRWVAGGELPEGEARAMLFQAAQSCGLVADDEHAVHKTINSGLSSGMREPRNAPVSSGNMRPEPSKVETKPTGQNEPLPHLHCVNAYDFLSMSFPVMEMLLSPILPRQGLCMLHAMRGIGKTFISLSVAYAVASGGKVFDRWGAPQPARVLFIDGEMPARTLQERLASLEHFDFYFIYIHKRQTTLLHL